MVDQLLRFVCVFLVLSIVTGCSDPEYAKFQISDTDVEVRAEDHSVAIYSEGTRIATVHASSNGYTVRVHDYTMADAMTVSFKKWEATPEVMRTVAGDEKSVIIIYDDRGQILEEWEVPFPKE